MKEKKKLSLKGMTLMECIIAIAVMALIAMIVVVAGVSAVHNLRIAHNVSEKNAGQSPFASAKLNAQKTVEITIDLHSASAGDGNGAPSRARSGLPRLRRSRGRRPGGRGPPLWPYHP